LEPAVNAARHDRSWKKARSSHGAGMKTEKRYRVESGRPCIDIELKTAHQLFDVRDPAPFRQRDLSADAVDYIVGAAEEIPAPKPFNVVFWVSEPPTEKLPDATIVEAVRSHFSYEQDRLERRIRQHLRQAELTLLAGLVALVVFLTLAELATMLTNLHLRQILREGLIIIGWVAIWRPLELLLYDWWPLGERRRLLRRILASHMSIVHRSAALRSAAG
jgi:hypothetical protein